MNDDLIKELLIWQKLSGINLLKEILPNILNEEKKQQVYELTNGDNSQAFISSKTKVATGTISNWWNKWEANGILEKNGGRYKHIISLKNLDLSISRDKDKNE